MTGSITAQLLLTHMIDVDDKVHLICSCGQFHESYTGTPAEAEGGRGGDPNRAWAEWVIHIEQVAAGDHAYDRGRLN